MLHQAGQEPDGGVVTKDDLRDFLRGQTYAVVASTADDGSAQAAVVGIAVSDACEIIFDTLGETRKARNMRRDARVAITLWDRERTVQLEGVADEPSGQEREAVLSVYFARFPDGKSRLSWAGLTHFRVRPTWVRFSDFSADPPLVELVEM
jgi:uncharacterized protein YhbP (UPF0306 family)